MTTVTVSRGARSVDIPLLSGGAQDPLLPVDIGKPHQNFQNPGSLNPRVSDFFSVQKTYTVIGRLTGNSAYNDAIRLADLIKSNSNGTELELSIPLPEYDSNIKVAPPEGTAEALSLAYPPGGRNRVDVELSLVRISETIAGANQPATSPIIAGYGADYGSDYGNATASTSNILELTDGNDTVQLKADVTVNRLVGRPNSTIRKNPSGTYPIHVDHHKVAYDAFELSFKEVNTIGDVSTLVDLFEKRLGRGTLTLDFNGLFGLGEFSVAPDGGNAIRHSRQSAEGAVAPIPTINLRRVRG
jgi:hypothetical protein